MKGVVTIPKWVFVILLAGAILNIFNYVHQKVNDEPKIHIHYYDERE